MDHIPSPHLVLCPHDCDLQSPRLDNIFTTANSFPEVQNLVTWTTLPQEASAWVVAGVKQPKELPLYLKHGICERLRTPELYARLSSSGVRVCAVLALYIYRFSTQGSTIEIAATDAFESVSNCVDYLTDSDARAIVEVIWATTHLWSQLLHDGDEAMRKILQDPKSPAEAKQRLRQRLIPGRAMCISVCNSLQSILSVDRSSLQWFSYARCFPYLVLPESFEGICNRPRGREAPVISKKFKALPLTSEEERKIGLKWKEMIALRSAIGLSTPQVSFTDYLLYLRVWHFLQDPLEYMSVCYQTGSTGSNEQLPHRSSADDGEALEEGEAVEDTTSARRSTTKPNITTDLSKSQDPLFCRFRDIELLGFFFQKRIKAKRSTKNLINPESIGWISDMLTAPDAFVELMMTNPNITSLIATNMLVLMRIHFQWPLHDDEPALLGLWGAHITVNCLHAYKKAVQSLLPVITFDHIGEARGVLAIELRTLMQKYDNITPITAPTDLDENPPDVDRTEPPRGTTYQRLKAFSSSGLEKLRAIANTSQDDMKSLAMTPIDLVAWRSDAYLETPLPSCYDVLSHDERLQQRWHDVLEKQKIDEDPANEIDQGERYLSRDLNCWRAIRAAALGGSSPIFLSDFNQDEEVELKAYLSAYISS